MPFSSTRPVGRRALLRGGLAVGAGLVAASPVLTACGSGGAGSDKTLTMAGWGDPSDTKRNRDFAAELSKKIGVDVEFQLVVGDYTAKLASQLAGGAAPDVFAIGDDAIAKLISTGKLQNLSDYLNSGRAPVKLDDFLPGVRNQCRGEDGGIYGLAPDCNPRVLWYNKDLLARAGVTVDPAAQFEAGTWTRDAMVEMVAKVRATGATGLVVQPGWGDVAAFITANGGTIFDESGKVVVDTDPNTVDAITWFVEQLRTGTFNHAGSLPKGQGPEPLFFADQLAFIAAGRWMLPSLKKLKGGFDVVPFPSPSGGDVMPVPLHTAAYMVNAASKNLDSALDLLGHIVSAEGQRFRLAGTGGAVPSVSGLDNLVTDGGVPAHSATFLEVARKAYTLPAPILRNDKVLSELNARLDKLAAAAKSGELDAKGFTSGMARALKGED